MKMNRFTLRLSLLLCLPSCLCAAPLLTELTPDNRLLIRRVGQAEPLLVQNARENFRPYLHPIVAPDGRGVLTQDAPGHHKWQHGLYVGLHKVNGHDFWTRDNAFRPRPMAAPSLAGNVVTWQVETAWHGRTNDATPILNETQRWTLTDLDDHYLLDLEWTLTAAVDVTFGAHEYGGLFLRMPWTKEANGDALSPEGKPADGQRARWLAVRMDIEGRTDGATMAILDHPNNPAHPAPWRLDGQLGFAPSRCILGDWKLAKGDSTTSRYRVVVRGGRAAADVIEAEFKRFATNKPDRVLFDFETGTYAGWTYEGAHAFEDKPFDTTEALQWREDRRPAGWQGKYMVALGDTRHGKGPDGRLVSDEFTIDQPYLNFLYGAEVNPRVFVALRVDGRQVRVAYGNNSYHLRMRGWDVREFAGKKARLVIEEGTPVDALLRLDYFHLSDTPPPSLENFAEERPQESSALRSGEFQPILEWTNKGVIHHTGLLKGHDNRWHLYGSTGTNAWDYSSDRAFHATASAITGPYTMEAAPLLSADASAGEKWIREPFVLLHDGTYYCYFLGSGTPWTGWDPTYRWKEGYFAKSSQGPYGLHLATSKDLKTWTRPKAAALFTEMPWCFNPYVTRVGDEWVMYYAGTVNAEVLGQHCLIARTSKDLLNWGERRIVLRSESTNAWPEHAFLHSPVVWQDRGAWWMLAGPIGNMNMSRFHYRGLWRSDDPFQWRTTVKERTPDNGLFLEGGAKVLRDGDGRQWVTHSGPWAGGVWLAPLHWNPAALAMQTRSKMK